MAFDPVRTLGDVVTLVRGTTYKSAQLGQPGPVLLGLGTIQRNGGFRADSLKTYLIRHEAQPSAGGLREACS